MRKLVLTAAVLCWMACAGGGEAGLRRALHRGSGVIELPAGLVEISGEIVLPDAAHDLEIRGAPSGSVLRAGKNFAGRAIFVVRSAARIRFRDFTIDGNRDTLEKRAGLPPSDAPFVKFSSGNGILAEGVSGLAISGVRFNNVAGFPVLVARSTNVLIERVVVADSGSRNEKGRNNTTGGILLEEGTDGFRVLGCALKNVRGNGVWTHSLYTSPRNRNGLIAGNRFDTIGRDAIQAGHATNIRVEHNSGVRIGYPHEAVDTEGGGIPVAIDTAGDVDKSTYTGNRFEDVNGKCIDLDGFHDGEVRGNTCITRGPAEDFPFGHYGIVFNNSNPDMQSANVVVSDNEIDGAKFGGIFVIGTGHRITGNRLRNLNTAHCNENAAKFGCLYFADQPDLLRSGIYLGKGADRPAIARGNLIADNEVSGWNMKSRCVVAAPGVRLTENTVTGNRCRDEEGGQ